MNDRKTIYDDLREIQMIEKHLDDERDADLHRWGALMIVTVLVVFSIWAYVVV